MEYFYPHPELFDDFMKPNYEEYSGNIVLWGAGRIGGIAEYCLRKKGVKVCAFCDIAEDKWGTEYCGHKVLSPKQLQENYPNVAIVISNTYHYTLLDELAQMGYENVFDCVDLFMNIDFDEFDFWMLPEYAIRNVEQYLSAVYEQVKGANTIDQIYLYVTTKCTLQCRDCAAYVPYIKNPCCFDTETVMSDFTKVLDCLGHIRVVNLYGGEPLLHPELAKMITMLAGESRIDRIGIITNGTLVPKEALLDAMKKDKRVVVRISDYGKLSTKKEEIIKLLSEYGIAYEMTNYSYWERPSTIAPCDESEEELILKFQRCTASNIVTMLNRKLYRCGVAGPVCDMGVFPPSETNYVDIKKYGDSEAMLYDRIKEFLERPRKKQYFDACRYCSGVHCIHFENRVPVAVQVDKKLEFPKLY